MLIAALLSAVLLQANPAPPTATTGAADTIATTAASVTGSVAPGGAATTYHVEYGTSTAYGLVTADTATPDDNTTVNVRVPLTGLTTDTTYHYRLVATNAAGTDPGSDRSLHTLATPHAPSASTSAARSVTAIGATLAGSVTPHGLATTAHFDYGTATSYGASTPEQAVGAGTGAVTTTASIGGLKPNTRYHFRVVATNSAGVARSSDRTFTTAKAPTGVAVTPSTTRPVWGSGLTITGKVSGVGGVPVALERQAFPFATGFAQLATATASSGGNFTFTVPPLGITTRLRVVTRTPIVAASPTITASVAVKVGLRTQRLAHHRARLTGATWPALPAGRASLQRQTLSGRWILVAHATPRALDANRSRYRFTVRMARRALAYRVVVLAHDGGAHVPGTSRVVTLPARRG
jgi:hypothetical protein